MAGTEGDIEAGYDRVTSPVLRVAPERGTRGYRGDYGPREGRIMKEHTSTATMFFNRDSGVRTCRLISGRQVPICETD
jgi:hypothetical protein